LNTYTGRRRRSEPKSGGALRRIFLQIAAALVITAAVFGIKSIGASYTDSLVTKIKNTLYYTVDYQTTVNQITSFFKSFTDKGEKNNVPSPTVETDIAL
jgi:hypothetical protein